MSFFSATVSPNQKSLNNVKVGTHFTLRKGHNNATTLAKLIHLDWVQRDYNNGRNYVSNATHGYAYKTTCLPASGVYVRTSEKPIWVKECQKYHLQVVHLGTGQSYWLSEWSWAHIVEYTEADADHPAHFNGQEK